MGKLKIHMATMGLYVIAKVRFNARRRLYSIHRVHHRVSLVRRCDGPQEPARGDLPVRNICLDTHAVVTLVMVDCSPEPSLMGGDG